MRARNLDAPGAQVRAALDPTAQISGFEEIETDELRPIGFELGLAFV
jgi:hypothetical protein